MVGRGRQASLAMTGRAVPLGTGYGGGAAVGGRPRSCRAHPTRAGARVPPGGGGQQRACTRRRRLVSGTRGTPPHPHPAALPEGHGGVPPPSHPVMRVGARGRRRPCRAPPVGRLGGASGPPPRSTPSPPRLGGTAPRNAPTPQPRRALPPPPTFHSPRRPRRRPARHPAGTGGTRAPPLRARWRRRRGVNADAPRGGCAPPRRGTRVYGKSTAAARGRREKPGVGWRPGGAPAAAADRAAGRRCRGVGGGGGGRRPGGAIPPRHPRRVSPPRHGHSGLLVVGGVLTRSGSVGHGAGQRRVQRWEVDGSRGGECRGGKGGRWRPGDAPDPSDDPQ